MAKLRFLGCVPFVLTILLVLTLASNMKVLYGDDTFNLSAFNYKTVLKSFEKAFRFPENLFQV